MLQYSCWLRLQHNRIVIVAQITPVSSFKARHLYTRFRSPCSGISPRTFRSPLTHHIRAHWIRTSKTIPFSRFQHTNAVSRGALIWCPRGDSNSHAFRQWLLRPSWLPLHHRGICELILKNVYNIISLLYEVSANVSTVA